MRLILLILLTHFLCIFPAVVNAAQWATVTADKAVIYSDQDRNSAIGYVSRGKKVRIGEVARNGGSVYPIVVNGRIAWIAEDDIQTSQRLADLESTSSRIKRRRNKVLKDYAVVSFVNTITNTFTTSNALTLKDRQRNFVGINVKKNFFKTIDDRFFVRANFEYLTSTQKFEGIMESVDLLTFQFEGVLKIFKAAKMNWNAYVGANVIPLATFELQDYFVTRGFGGGFSGGSDFSFYLKDNLALTAEINVHYDYLLGMSVPEPIDEDFNFSMFGVKTLFGITYLY
jgi:hypothetical protein